MDVELYKLVTAGALFLLIFLSGYWMAHAGKPYNGVLFNLHKLIGLGALVYLGITVSRIQQAQGLASLQIVLVALAALCFIATIITGGLASVDRTFPAFVSLGHKVLPYLTLLSSAAAVLLRR